MPRRDENLEGSVFNSADLPTPKPAKVAAILSAFQTLKEFITSATPLLSEEERIIVSNSLKILIRLIDKRESIDK